MLLSANKLLDGNAATIDMYPVAVNDIGDRNDELEDIRRFVLL